MDDVDDSADAIRRRMAESRSRLSDKLESLEEQVTGTVQSTGSAVSETAAAVKETVDAITDAVQGAVKTVSETFDLQQQMKHHPWLMIGGAVAVGYLAHELSRCPISSDSAIVGRSRHNLPELGGGDDAVERRMRGTDPTWKSNASAPRSSVESSTSFLSSIASQLLRATAVSVTESLRTAASQAGPRLAEYLAGDQQQAKPANGNGTEH